MKAENVDRINIDFQKLFEAAPDLYLLLSPELRIIGASDAYLKATLTKRTEITGRGLFDVFPDNPGDDTADGVSNLHASLNAVLQKRMPHKMPVQKYDIRRPDGTFEERFWSPLNTPVFDENNEILYIIHRVEDVTEAERVKKDMTKYIKRAEEMETIERDYILSLKASEDRFIKIFNFSPISIFITDMAAGRIMYVNNAFEKLFLFKRKQAIGKTIVELGITGELSRDILPGNIKQKGGHNVVMELDMKNARGEIKNILSSTEIIEIDNKECFMKVMIDITERKQQQDAILQLNNELEAFSYSVSHDLRAPLRAVTGFARMLEEDYTRVLDDEGKRLLGTISRNAEKMGRLIDDLLNFSRLGRKNVVLRDTDMNELVNSAIAEISKSTAYHAEIKVGTLHPVRSDVALMMHVLVNLIGNAIKYSSKKEHPLIEIQSEVAGNDVIFSVKDNGAGFDMRYVGKLFGVFQRLHNVDEFEGTGVGLAIVQRIINKHGGRVWAEGKVDEGATIYFSLPVN